MLPTRVLAPCLALATTACAAASTPPPATTDVLRELPRVSNSRKSPCWQQREIATQNAWVDAATGKEKDPVYRAPCDLAQQGPGKTS
jgi:hypothetical protein